MKKIKEFFGRLFKKNKEDDKVKVKWSLKKKLLLGGGLLSGLALGIFAYGKNQPEVFEEDNDFEDEDYDYTDTDEPDFDMTEEVLEEEVETQE